MTRSNRCVAAIITAVFLLAGCASGGNRYKAADEIGIKNNFTKKYIKTNLCTLTAFYKFTKPGSRLTVYIEGDGFAWRTRHALSDDPTPRNHLMLSLAGLDPSENVAYLARPGQLTESERPDCDSIYWSLRRSSPEVITAMNSAIDHLKAESRAKEIDLVGFSGGAAIAVIVASWRTDIASIRTISGALDHEAIARARNTTPLSGSLNPIDFVDKVSHIPQRHFVGTRDKLIPVSIAESFAARSGDKTGESITVVEGATHTRGWEKSWPSLLGLPLYKNRSAH